MGYDCFVLSVNTKDFLEHLKLLDDFFDFRKLNESHELFSNLKQRSDWEI